MEMRYSTIASRAEEQRNQNQIKPQMRCQSDRATRNDLIAHVTMPRIGSEPRNPSNLATPD
ncbi:uncharacterized protein Dsimw501_GD28327, isoform B [Drosophila simulans]|uniref:Uncharacterized protein, isoform B n=1 Tax=Drosophila simulans TaxID=7240 RepID=A0A0J9RXP5_DROSI|nr:uncharacterized protein Dsimw501_GD28327, isoform B [Drosophila simulans]